MICQTCGRTWDDSDTTTWYYMSSLSHSAGSYTSPSQIAGDGEDILTCPADPLPQDEDMRRFGGPSRKEESERVDRDRPGGTTVGGMPTAIHQPGRPPTSCGDDGT